MSNWKEQRETGARVYPDIMPLCYVCGVELPKFPEHAYDMGSCGMTFPVCERCMDDYADKFAEAQDRQPGDFVEEDFT